MKKRIVSLSMVLVLCLTLLPISAFAAEGSGAVISTSSLCAHHTVHDDTCGYVAGIAESPCTHEHGDECYTTVTSCIHEHTEDCYPAVDNGTSGGGATDPDAEPGKDASPSDTEPSEDATFPDTESGENVTSFEAEPGEPVALFEPEPGEDTTPSEAAEPTECSHVCSEESGCIKRELDCQHEHDDECGYAPAVEGQPCTYVCTLCGMTGITAWSWVDTLEVINPENGVLALSASAESPTLYNEIIALLPTEITATTQDGEETIALGGWTCPDYPKAGACTGKYKFTAALPDGYALAADAPALTVTVELSGVAMLADTTHTDHPICGASCTDGYYHRKTTFPNWLASDYGADAKSLILRVGGPDSTYGDPLDASGSAWILPAGTYYLADDIHIDKPIRIEGDVTICLNGHDICVDDHVWAFDIYQQAKSSTLTLTDCKEACGEVKTHNTDKRAYGVDIHSKGTFNMYGGKISGCLRGVYVDSYGTFNMRGGMISDSVGLNGVTVYKNATFNMYGGEISHNTDYGVDVEKGATFNMYDGVIKYDTKPASYNRVGVRVWGGKFNMSGGMISGCGRGVHVTCYPSYTNSDFPIGGNFTMTGGTIKENDIGVDVFSYFYMENGRRTDELWRSAEFTMTGGEIINNTDMGVDMGVYADGASSEYESGGNLTVGGTARIQNNSNNGTYSWGNLFFDKCDKDIKQASQSLTEGAYIGITTPYGTLPTEENPLLIAENLYSQVEVADYFHSDRDGYVIVCANTDDAHTTHTLYLTVSPHTHNWEYSKEANNKSTVYVSCTGTTGTCAYQTTPATLTMSIAKEVYDYDKNMEAPAATLTHSENWPSSLEKAKESDIKYWKSTDGGISYTVQITNKNDLKTPGKYLAQLDFNGKWLEAHFSVVDNSKKDPDYTAPTAKTGLTYNGRAQALINQGSTTGGTMQYKLGNGEYSTTIPTATDAGTYTVYYKVVGNATYNDTIEQSITVTIKQATLAGSPTFTPVTKEGKTLADVTLTAPAGWPEGTFSWVEGTPSLTTPLPQNTPVTQGTKYYWVFTPNDISNYTRAVGYLVLWSNTSGGNSGGNSGGGNSSNTPDDNDDSSNTGDNDNGSSDTGNSDNGSSNTNTPSTPVTVPVSGDEKNIQVDAAVSGTTATIKNVDLSKLDTVIGDNVKTGVVTIDFSVLKKVDTVKLPSNVVKKIAEAVNDPNNDAKGLEIVLTNGTSIEFSAKVLGEKTVQANGAEIIISLKRIADSSLNTKQKLAVGNRPALDINVTMGGKPISDMNGKVTVSASYELKPGEQASGIVVYYVDANGNRKLCETSYDPISKRVSWKTSQLSSSSVYMIGYDASRVKPGTGSYVTYTVQRGNTLSMIAKKHGCTVAEIMAANSGLIKNPNRIYVGWQFKIPQH